MKLKLQFMRSYDRGFGEIYAYCYEGSAEAEDLFEKHQGEDLRRGFYFSREKNLTDLAFDPEVKVWIEESNAVPGTRLELAHMYTITDITRTHETYQYACFGDDVCLRLISVHEHNGHMWHTYHSDQKNLTYIEWNGEQFIEIP